MTNPALLDRVSDVIGWGLIHFLWQGTVLAVLLGATALVAIRHVTVFSEREVAHQLATLGANILIPNVTGTLHVRPWSLDQQMSPSGRAINTRRLSGNSATVTS